MSRRSRAESRSRRARSRRRRSPDGRTGRPARAAARCPAPAGTRSSISCSAQALLLAGARLRVLTRIKEVVRRVRRRNTEAALREALEPIRVARMSPPAPGPRPGPAARGAEHADRAPLRGSPLDAFARAETAALITAAGGQAIAVRVDHTVEAEVKALVARIVKERGRLDVLVDAVAGEDPLMGQWASFWKVKLDAGRPDAAPVARLSHHHRQARRAGV